MHLFRSWATRRGLKPSETVYVARKRGHRQWLRFSVSGQESVERGYRTHWVSPELSERKRQRLAERQSGAPDVVAVSSLGESSRSQRGGSGELPPVEDAGSV